MKLLRLTVIAVTCVALLGGCTLKDDGAASAGDIPAPSDVAAPPADALKTPSGLASKVLIVGLGSIHPTIRSTVVIHYTGWTTDGKMFDSSYRTGQPATFGVADVIPGFTEALELMVVGEKRRFWIPGSLAYDAIPGSDGPKGMLVFEIELLDLR